MRGLLFGLLSLAGIASVPGEAVALVSTAPLLYVYDLTGDRLLSFRADAPGTVLGDVALTGLASDEYLLGIDFRPATGELFGIASNGHVTRVVEIARGSGIVTDVGVGDAAPPGFAGMDFNPTVDRIRFVTDTNASQRWNPILGTAIGPDTDLAYLAGDPGDGVDPSVVHVAYLVHTGSLSTTLFGIDSARDVLVRIGGVDGNPSPNIGQLTTIGPLGIGTNLLGGFDIEPDTDTAYAVLRSFNVQGLYTIHLATGAATLVGPIVGSGAVDGLAIVPEPSAVASSSAALLALYTRQRRRRR